MSSEYEPPLVLDHYADVQVEGASATDVCENVPNRIVSVHIYAGDGTDVTGNYAVTTEDGTLTITPRPITVTAGSDTKVYDGTPLTCGEATVSSALSPALVLDHEIRFAVSGSQTEIGESENTLTYAAVFTADGTDVSRNYQITEENGTLTVLVPGTLVVRTGGAEKIFDGTALTNAEYTIENTLGENFDMQFTVEVSCTGSQLHAGETENTGISFSAEYGKKIALNKNGFYIEPQAQLTYGHLDGDTYTTSNGVSVRQEGIESLVGRVGFNIGWDVNETSNIYLKANVLHEFLGDYGVSMSDAAGRARLTGDYGDTWFEYGLGAAFKFGRPESANFFYCDVERSDGGDLEEEWHWNAGFRFEM